MPQTIKQLDLTSLRLFRAVQAEGGVVRAATAEHIAPSAISRRISELESTLGTKLLFRDSSGTRLTRAGEVVLAYAMKIDVDLQRMIAEITHVDSSVYGTVRVLANLSSMVQFVPRDLVALEEKYPDVVVSFEERLSAGIIRGVSDDVADVGITHIVHEGCKLSTVPYRREVFALVVASGHPLANSEAIRFSETLGYVHIGFPEGSALGQILAMKAGELGRLLTYRIRVSSFDSACSLVAAKAGICIMPTRVAEVYRSSLQLRIIPLSDDWAARHLMLVFKRYDSLSLQARAFVDFLSARSNADDDSRDD
ncbi:LysR substrate-binding domain-containing protein [Cupriavidus sp. MP-37]|uniref:LysR substrate-binding domain-containing protein n=1 Tax=Cupriavidus sp. MP-37 TaxID=2884455 RepID=UPI001D0B1223|nr:LysR substrate-binding domain-containing protein [Cupriavidus sp. MP-37]UDM53956.1 LysR family transcriptional regulator [Cupriavidus sp. MP-37]